MKFELVKKNINHVSVRECVDMSEMVAEKSIMHYIEVTHEISVDDFKINVLFANCRATHRPNLLEDDYFYIKSHDILNELAESTEFYFINGKTEERVKDLLESVQKLIPTIKNMHDLHALHDFLNKCRPDLSDVLPSPHTHNIEDYQQDEGGKWFRALNEHEFKEYCNNAFIREKHEKDMDE